MRHRWMGRKLGRNNSGRKALEKHMVCALFTYGRIVTTVEKAKEFRSSAEREPRYDPHTNISAAYITVKI